MSEINENLKWAGKYIAEYLISLPGIEEIPHGEEMIFSVIFKKIENGVFEFSNPSLNLR